jgi:ComF family protein
MPFATRLTSDLARLFYPHTCLGCGYELYQPQQFLCPYCLNQLPVTGYEKSRENQIARMFTGRLPVQQAAAWLFFGKNGLTQTLIHHLKYRGHTELGLALGRMMATRLQQSAWLDDVDVLVPLPLNRRKLVSRGYNQSTLLCRGMGQATGLPVEEVAVMRTVPTETQTRKSRIARWMNVAEVFDLLDTGHLHGKHALLVDDVITTGATMDACGQVLLRIPGLRLSVLSLAVASRV